MSTHHSHTNHLPASSPSFHHHVSQHYITHCFLISSHSSAALRYPIAVSSPSSCSRCFTGTDSFRETNLICIYMSGHLSVVITSYLLSVFTEIPSFCFLTTWNCIPRASPLSLSLCFRFEVPYPLLAGFVGAHFVMYESVTCRSSPVSCSSINGKTWVMVKQPHGLSVNSENCLHLGLSQSL